MPETTTSHRAFRPGAASRLIALAGVWLLLVARPASAQPFQPGQIVEVNAYGSWGTVGRVQRVDSSGVLVLYRGEDGSFNERTGFTRYFDMKDVRLKAAAPLPTRPPGSGALGVPSAGSASPQTSVGAFKVGDRMEGWNIAWYKGTVVRVGVEGYVGHYLIKHDEYSQDAYYKEANVRRLGAVPAGTSPASIGGAAPTGAVAAPTAGAGTGLKPGTYGCGVFLSGRYTPTQTLTLQNGSYSTTHGPGGSYSFDPANSRVNFRGGALSDQVGQYEANNNGILRLNQRKDLGESAYTQKWRSQVCSPR